MERSASPEEDGHQVQSDEPSRDPARNEQAEREIGCEPPIREVK